MGWGVRVRRNGLPSFLVAAFSGWRILRVAGEA